MAQIFVALWTRDTEKKTLNHNIGTRRYYVKAAMTAAYQKYKSVVGRYAGTVQAIFVAPEYLFTNPREEEHAVTLTRAVSEEAKNVLVRHFTDVSRSYPEMLLVPGTIIYRLDQAAYPIHFAKSQQKAIQHVTTLIDTVKSKSSDMKRLAPSSGGAPTLTDKLETLKGSTPINYIVRNKMYAFLNGSVAAKYGKKADMYEATGTVPGVFIPGSDAGIKEIGGIRFGFEICFDHDIGVLKALGGGPSNAADIHIIASAEIPNKFGSMFVKPGGFVLHASSKHANSKVFYRPTATWKKEHAFNDMFAEGSQATDVVFSHGSENIDGDPVDYYLITRE